MKNTVVAAVNHSVGDACGVAALKHEYENCLFQERTYYLYANVDLSLPVRCILPQVENGFDSRSTIDGREEYRVVQEIM